MYVISVFKFKTVIGFVALLRTEHTYAEPIIRPLLLDNKVAIGGWSCKQANLFPLRLCCFASAEFTRGRQYTT